MKIREGRSSKDGISLEPATIRSSRPTPTSQVDARSLPLLIEPSVCLSSPAPSLQLPSPLVSTPFLKWPSSRLEDPSNIKDQQRSRIPLSPANGVEAVIRYPRPPLMISERRNCGHITHLWNLKSLEKLFDIVTMKRTQENEPQTAIEASFVAAGAVKR
ncbi:unnamed protein product [Danaus chrysippus]|uniref:(African queen) hypothetical protein n=1 Tax=Danaus chrysippus TaxID=151541 RepID=A0A8J2QTK0_9NEOP|nr:unnamed protein product [Danaus chrysippus]